jgi:hypothetical protein
MILRGSSRNITCGIIAEFGEFMNFWWVSQGYNYNCIQTRTGTEMIEF